MSARRRSLLAALAVPLAVLLSLVAVGVANAGRAPASDHGAITTPTITISAFAYHSPSSVPHGALIKVVNKDAFKHTVTSDVAGKFNVIIPAHSSKTFHAPAVRGTYRFHCTFHATMHGILHVS